MGKTITISNEAETRGFALGVNMEAMAYWVPSYMFTNQFKHVGKLGEDVYDRDVNGYPTSLGTYGFARARIGQHTGWPTASDYHLPGGDYVLLWTGDGSFTITNGGGTVVTTETNRMVYRVPTDGPTNMIYVNLTAIGDPHPTDIAFVMPGFEDTYDSTDLFHPKVLNRLEPFGAIRFMDMLETNDSTFVTGGEWKKEGFYSWARTWADFDYMDQDNGVPMEVLVDLCNAANCDLWVTKPHLCDTAWDTTFAQIVSDNLNADLNVYLEFSNECWNWGFQQTHWLDDQVAFHTGATNKSHIYGLKAVEMFNNWLTVLPQARVTRVLCGQNAALTFANHWDDYSHADWGTNKCYHYADAYGVAPYIGRQITLAEKAAFLNQSISSIHTEMKGLCDSFLAPLVAANKAWADTNGLRLIGYEGGTHYKGTAADQAHNDEEITQRLVDINTSPYIEEVIRYWLNMWREQGGENMMYYSALSGHHISGAKYGCWGIVPTDRDDPTDYGKHVGLVQWDSDNPKWW